jgi:RNA polymerase sigma-70 factor, ECF subfamily
MRLGKKYTKYNDSDLIKMLIPLKQHILLEILFKRYYPLVVGVGLKYLKQKENAEDMAMVIFSGLIAKLMKHEVCNFRSWLYTLTINEAKMILRKKKLDTIQVIEENTSDYGKEDFEYKLLLEQNIELMEEHILQLKEEQKIAINKFYMESKSYIVIAQEENWTVKQVKSYVQNGKRNLSLMLKSKES